MSLPDPIYHQKHLIHHPVLVIGTWKRNDPDEDLALTIPGNPEARQYPAKAGVPRRGIPCHESRQLRKWRKHSVSSPLQLKPRAIQVLTFLVALMCTGTGCSVKKFAISKLADSLASQGTSSFATDDDPELVGDALPFALKLMESLLDQVPRHRGLLFATASGFTEYSYVWVQQPADEIEPQDVERARELRLRARKLYLRARDYGIRGLEVKHPGFGASLRQDPKSAVRVAREKDVPLLYWTAASWGSAISVSKDNPDLVADQPVIEALIDRALELDPDFDHGAIHGFLISYESARQGAKGDFAARSREHFERQVSLTGGNLASPFVSLAETVSVSKQERSEFESLLKRALAVDLNRKPEWRLNNAVMQRRARWLLSREDDLFLTDRPEGQNATRNQVPCPSNFADVPDGDKRGGADKDSPCDPPAQGIRASSNP